MYNSNAKTVMFISGAFVSHHYWENWIVFFEAHGYKAVAPPWIHKNDHAENLRLKTPCCKIACITLCNLLSYYKEIIELLPEKPILIGHSYGGLLVQLLVQKELAAAGICINSFPPGGITTLKFSFYKKIIRFSCNNFSLNGMYYLSLKNWKKFFQNEVSNEDQQNAYEKYIIPESKKVLRHLISPMSRINFRTKHVPLLFISCSDDKMVNPDLIYWNFKKYTNVHSITCCKNFNDHNHFVIVDQQWKEPAEHIAKWLNKVF